MNNLIEIQSVNKIYATDRLDTYALKDINLEIEKGEFVSIEGPSGAGKSTLLNILGLLGGFNSGEYLLHGKKTSKLSNSQKAFLRNSYLGFVFQEFNLIDYMTVKENVELPLLYGKKLTKLERLYKIEAVLDSVNLTHRIHHRPAQLSGGQQQRVAVARALVSDPEIIFADEPTGNLDSTNGAQIMNILKNLNEGNKTICMVTHDVRYRSLASHRFEIRDGLCEKLF